MFRGINIGPTARLYGGGSPNLRDKGMPLWRQVFNKDVIGPIPGTTLNGSACYPGGSIYANASLGYCGGIFNEGIYWSGLGGGHGDSYRNQMNRLNLMLDAPAWELMIPTTSWDIANPEKNVPYYSDGKPSSRHTYRSGAFDPKRNKLVYFGARYVWGGGTEFLDVASYDIATNTYDPAGTYQSGLRGGVPDSLGNLLIAGSANAAVFDWDLLQNFTAASWTTPPYGGDPMAYDSSRDEYFGFGLAVDNGEGGNASSAVAANVFRWVAGSNRRQVTRTPITFSATPDALAEWRAAAPSAAGMAYDPINDQYIFYDGTGAKKGVFWIIKPNATNDWTLLKRPANVSDATYPETMSSGLWNRFAYVPELRGIVFHPSSESPLCFFEPKAY